MEALHKQPRLDDKGGEHRGENSWVQTAAKSCLLFFMPLLLFSLDEAGEDEDRPLLSFCLAITTFPFSVLKLLQFSGAWTNIPAFTNDQDMRKRQYL